MKASDFEMVKDAENIPSFFLMLGNASFRAWNVVLLTLIDYYKIYENLRCVNAVKILRHSIEKSRDFELLSYDRDELAEMIEMSYGKKHHAVACLFLACRYVRDNETLKHLEMMVDLDDEYILPHMKLALAYCPTTNGGQQ